MTGPVTPIKRGPNAGRSHPDCKRPGVDELVPADGETERARVLCQKLLSFAGPLQLYAEEIDVTTGQHLGNFPQAFTHLALIEAVSMLIQSDHGGNSAPVG